MNNEVICDVFFQNFSCFFMQNYVSYHLITVLINAPSSIHLAKYRLRHSLYYRSRPRVGFTFSNNSVLISSILLSSTYLRLPSPHVNLCLVPPSSTQTNKMTLMMEDLNRFRGHMRPEDARDTK